MDGAKCAMAGELLRDEMMSLLSALLMQGLIARIIDMDENFLDASFPSGFVLSQVLLPLIVPVSSENADAIRSIFPSPSGTVRSVQKVNIFIETIRNVVPAMGMSCTDLGSWLADPTLIICSEYVAPKSPLPFSYLGFDVRDMRRALSAGDFDAAQSIYVNGMNALDGNDLISLQRLSISGYIEMGEEPVFELFRHVYQDNHEYADAFVMRAFHAENKDSKHLAADAVVAMNVWMFTIHFMTQGVIGCHNGENQESIHDAIHQAAAFYVGDADPEKDQPTGNLFFGLAQEMSDYYVFFEDKEPNINSVMLSLFGHAHALIRSDGEGCSVNSTTVSTLNAIVNTMTRQMTIPLVQGLVNALKIADQGLVHLYASTILPLISQCNDRENEFFESVLIGGSLVATNVEANIDMTYRVLPCLGLMCSDIGYHVSDVKAGSAMTSRPGCEKTNRTTYLGYQPIDPRSFESVLRIDQDLREIQFLLHATSIQAASFIYRHGRHVTTSLKQLQDSVVRSNVSLFKLFATYYGDDDYIDRLVWDPLHSQTFFGDHEITHEERETLSIGFAEMVLLPHSAIAAMHLSLTQCQAVQDIGLALRSWDKAVAALLGSSSLTGSGRLSIYDLALSTCSPFETCHHDNPEESWHRHLMELFFAGIGALEDRSCVVLETFITKIEALLLVPVIQEILRASTSVKTMNRAFVASRALAPLLAPEVASRLERLFPRPVRKHDYMITAATMDLLSPGFTDLGIDCEWIGRLNGMDPCRTNNLKRFHSARSGLLPGGRAGIGLTMAVLLVAAYVYYHKKQQRQRGTPFIRNGKTDSTSNDSSTHSHHEFEIDRNRLDHSFRISTRSSSSKAERALRRISLYADDSDPFTLICNPCSDASSSSSDSTMDTPTWSVWQPTSFVSTVHSIFVEETDTIL